VILSTLGFVLEAAAVVTLVILGERDKDRFATLAEILDRVMTTRAARICILTFWWWLGWHFLFTRTVDPGAGAP
jgi:hypothetical protein